MRLAHIMILLYHNTTVRNQFILLEYLRQFYQTYLILKYFFITLNDRMDHFSQKFQVKTRFEYVMNWFYFS